MNTKLVIFGSVARGDAKENWDTH
ncbi:MAG: hypothetical protein HA491_05085 [Candidatus Verstraetearchaeota archaeon]|nr:hypothetical protein [Candidatus Verstraetearchaeota archaeon]